MAAVEDDVLAAFLDRPPFDALDPDARRRAAERALIEELPPGTVILDAFAAPSVEVFVIIAGRVDLWHVRERLAEPADERLGRGDLFGFSAMLAERSIGPRAVAVSAVTVARIPAALVAPAFTTTSGTRFLVEAMARTRPVASTPPSYSLVDELIPTPPLVLPGETAVAEVARRLRDTGSPCAVIDRGGGRYGVITDATLRDQVVITGRSDRTPAAEVMDTDVTTVTVGDSAAEALILLLDRNADVLLVLDRRRALRGVITPRDFAVSPTTAGVSLHEQVRRAGDVEELITRTARIPGMLGDLLVRGLAPDKIIAVFSAIVDTVVRRALGLVFDDRPELSTDAFTWLSLGSNGRREAVLSSDVDSAVAFDDGTSAAEQERYRAAFAEVVRIVTATGLGSDQHGATARQSAFARTNAEWRAAARRWLDAPERDNGAMMTSLLVDGRPIHGDPGLPEVTRVFGELRAHPGTMRLLLQESLAYRARQRTVLDLLNRRGDTFDVKAHALVPIANIARWAALSAGSSALSSTARLRTAGGSAMLPTAQADTLAEIFTVLQRLRLRQQLAQRERGEPATDVLVRHRLSPIDRAVIGQAVREIAAVQRRMDNVSLYLPSDDWSDPEPVR